LKIGIIGQGRIGRTLLKQLIKTNHHVVAVWDKLVDCSDLAYLLRYDSIHGHASFPVFASAGDSTIHLNNQPVRVFNDPVLTREQCSICEVDIIIECSGKDQYVSEIIRWGSDKIKHLIVTRLHPEAEKTVILGANETDSFPGSYRILSSGTCTGNCLLPILKVLESGFRIECGVVNILHPYLATQNILDNPHPGSDLSFYRAASLSVVPATTHLVQSIDRVFPHLTSKFQAICYRVPTPAVLMMDVNIVFEEPVDGDVVREVLIQAAETSHKGILTVFHDPLVSLDFTGSTWSAAIDGKFPSSGKRRLHKLILWQDNETGYCQRVIDLIDKFLV